MSDYPNPYDFVPLETEAPVRIAWKGAGVSLERPQPDRYSGRLNCLLHPETPLFVHGKDQQGRSQRRFFALGGRPGISASSLKGAIRSVYEMASNSCLSALSEDYMLPGGHRNTYDRTMTDDEFQQLHPRIDLAQRVPSHHQPCTSLQSVCPGCLLFGLVEKEQQEGMPLAGRLMFSDARPLKTQRVTVEIPGGVGGPHPWHNTFYFQDAGQGPILGRKLYFHHKDYSHTLRLYGAGNRGELIQLDGHKGDFEFTIDFFNLTEQELALLTYVLALEDSLRHHLFFAKSFGLGSAQIQVQRIDILHSNVVNSQDRFISLSPPPPGTVSADDMARQGKALWLSRPQAQPAFDAFSRILRWPGVTLYQYPDFRWFRRTPGSSSVTLAEYQEGVRSKADAARPTTSVPPPARSSPQPAGGRQRGRVESFDRGWGFIRSATNQKVFVRFNEIRGTGYRSLSPGDEVEYEVRMEEKGPRAYDVVVLSTGGQRR